MDANQFDQFSRIFATMDTRRSLTRRVLGVPILAGLLALLTPAEVTAADDDHGSSHRRRRRGTRHKHDKNRVRRNKKHKPNPRHKHRTPSPLPPPPPGPRCTGVSPSEDLQAAIESAVEGAIVTLCSGTWPLPATLVIAKSLTVRGAGTGQTILDGQDTVRVLRIASGATATVQNLTIARGRASGSGDDGSGGGVANEGDLTLDGVSVERSTATGNGGGIVNLAGTTTLQGGSRVTGNTTTGGGGAGLSANGGTLRLLAGTAVTDNEASNNVAGGVGSCCGGTVFLDADVLICDNRQDLGGQCSGTLTGPGTCPNPASGVCP